MGKAIRILALGALVGAALGLVAAGPGEAAGHRQHVVIQNRQFTPAELTVEAGDEVTWTNKDGPRVHSVTADDGSFDSSPDCSAGNPGACMDERAEYSHTFPAEGRFPYYSRTYGGPGGQGTSGVIVVVAEGTATPPPCPPTTTSTTPPSTSTTPPSTAAPASPSAAKTC